MGTSVISLWDFVHFFTELAEMEFFCLVYDSFSGYFYLSLCYADRKMMTITYDIAEFCDWDGDESKTAWNVGQLTEEIINDIEGAVPARLRVQAG